jgi:hypothetical protein
LPKRCGAFSIRAKINAFELHDVDTKKFHALVTDAEIIKVSLTNRPCSACHEGNRSSAARDNVCSSRCRLSFSVPLGSGVISFS